MSRTYRKIAVSRDEYHYLNDGENRKRKSTIKKRRKQFNNILEGIKNRII